MMPLKTNDLGAKMADYIALGPFFEVERTLYDRLYDAWASGRPPAEISQASFAASLNGRLMTAAGGRFPSDDRAIPASQLAGYVADGSIRQVATVPGQVSPISETFARLGAKRESADVGRARRRLDGLRARRSARRAEGPSRAERLERLISTDEGWAEYLAVQAEHPGRSPYNTLALCEYREREHIDSTYDLLTYEQATELGGHVRLGSKGCQQTIVKMIEGDDGRLHRGGYETVTLFAAAACEDIPEESLKQRPVMADTADPETMDLFLTAAEKVDLESLSPAAEFVFFSRYGLLEEDDKLPPRPRAGSPRELVAALKDIGAEARAVCCGIDRAVGFGRSRDAAREPEPGRSEADRGEAPTPEEPAPEEKRTAADRQWTGPRIETSEMTSKTLLEGALSSASGKSAPMPSAAISKDA